MSVSAGLNAALTASEVTVFNAVQIALPTMTINLLNSAGVVTFPVNGAATTFTGLDPIFGALASVDPAGSAMGNATPRCSIVLLPPSKEAIGTLTDPNIQGAPVRAYVGAFDNETGQVIGQPHQFWNGILDVAYGMDDGGSHSVELDTVSVLAKFLTRKEGRRLTVSWQQTHFPGARGLAFNVAATQTPSWGTEGIYGTGIMNGGTGGTVGGIGGGGADHIWAMTNLF